MLNDKYVEDELKPLVDELVEVIGGLPEVDMMMAEDNPMADDDDHDHDGIPYAFKCPGVTIAYENLQDSYILQHKKIPKSAQPVYDSRGKQRLARIGVKEGTIKILVQNRLSQGTPVVNVVVQRERNAFAEARQINEGDKKIVQGGVAVPAKIEQLGDTTWRLTVDLDSVYATTENGVMKQVYALCPSNIEVTNRFQLVTELYVKETDIVGNVNDRLIGKKESKPFLLRIEPRTRTDNPMADDDDDDHDGIPYAFKCPGVKIAYENLQDSYFKEHKKIPKSAQPVYDCHGNPKQSWMRVKEGTIKILVQNRISEGTPVVNVVVQRERNAFAEARQINEGDKKIVQGGVAVPTKIEQLGDKTWRLTADLDSVYNAAENGQMKEVYALSPSNIEVTNRFQLVTELYVRETDILGNVNDHLIGKKESRPFLLRTEPRTKAGGKTENMNSPVGSDRSPASSTAEELPDGAFNRLEARKGYFDSLNANRMQTRGRDIGYHIPLNDLSQKGKFVEGDVVVFIGDENNKAAIEKLSSENYKKANLAGVITRSNYVESVIPGKTEMGETDMVCVLGIVKVKVLGPVRNGEQLYAFPKRPGVAATSTIIGYHERDNGDKPLLLGQAIESKTDVGLNEEILVPAFVSVVNGIGCLAMHQAVADVQVKTRQIIEERIKHEAKKVTRGVFWLKLMLLFILSTIGLALWQRYAPNTALRKSICKHGSLHKQMIFTYRTSWQELEVIGLQFGFEGLKDKLYMKPKQRNDKKGVLYFINLKRCYNKGVSYTNEYLDGTQPVAGPEVFSIDKNCNATSLKYYSGNKWVPLHKHDVKITLKCGSDFS